jgi:hypothetical protein
MAKKIKNTVERKGATVKKDNTDKAIKDLGKKFKSTKMTGASSSSAAKRTDRLYQQQEEATNGRRH